VYFAMLFAIQPICGIVRVHMLNLGEFNNGKL
jgi:hypothetical protein